MRRAGALIIVAAAYGCATAGGAGTAGSVDAGMTPGAAAAADSLVPPGYGTLRQDEVTVSLLSGALLVKVTPLDEAVIRLLAPDTYDRLHALRTSREAEAASAMMREPELFLVSFFSYEPDVEYQPEDVQVLYQARLLRPVTVLPVTSGWGRQRLGQQETQNAVYAFDEQIDFDQVFTVRYGTAESSGWEAIRTRLRNERGRILSRVR